MTKETNNRVCPVENAGGLDNWLRKLLQNPQKITKPYIYKDSIILDLGCGPGVFSVEMAKMLGDSGKVIAADLQQGMLDKVKQKITGTELEQRIELYTCEQDKIGLNQKVDFALAFYVIHEVPSQDNLFKELKSIIKQGGKLLIVEPNFHVSKQEFEIMIEKLKTCGFEIIDRPKVFFSRSIVVANNG